MFIGAIGVTLVSSAAEGNLKFFGDVEVFLPSNVADGEKAVLDNMEQTFVAHGGSDAGTITTPAAIGLRLGLLYPVENLGDVGGSVGYINGPNSEIKLTDNNPTYGISNLDYTRELSFVRVLGEFKKEYVINPQWRFKPGFGVGMAFGSDKERVATATNLFAGAAGAGGSTTWSGLTWEITSGFACKMKTTDLNIAVKYAAFPKLDGDPAWGTIGISVGLSFGQGGSSTPSKTEIVSKYHDNSYSGQSMETFKQEPVEKEPMPENIEAAESYETYMERAADYFAQKDYTRAIDEYDQALKVLPENDEREIHVLERKGAASLKQEDYSAAKEFYMSAIKTAKTFSITDKTVVNAYLGLAYCLQETGNTKWARINYKTAWKLTKDPNTKRRIERALNELKTSNN